METTRALGDHSAHPAHHLPVSTVGILQNTLLPSLSLHSSLSLVAYTAARVTKRVELKDWLWPSGLLANAWYNAVVHPSFSENIPISSALANLSWPQKLLLGGVTVWGTRLFYRIASRSVRRGKDDPRYDGVKQESGFWNKAFFTVFLPEAVFQAVIGLGWSVPFTTGAAGAVASPPVDYAGLLRGLAVGLFTAGLGMEVLADAQIEHQKKQSDDLCRSGVWSIVRHPNYLGDALVHASFAVLAYASGIFHPVSVLGPVANYAFLRFVGGDKENEATQESRYKSQNPSKYAQLEDWRQKKNSFWPSVKEVANPWTWALVAIGGAGVVVESGLRRYLRA